MSPVSAGAGIEVEIEARDWVEALPDVEALARRAAVAALGDETGALTVLLTDDAAVAALNQRFRGKAGATNVLSFPAPQGTRDEAGRTMLGDLALAYGVCVAEAALQGKPLADHMAHLVVHGVLHLLGHDHIADDEAETMEAAERALLAGLGIPDPYLSRDDAHHDRRV